MGSCRRYREEEKYWFQGRGSSEAFFRGLNCFVHSLARLVTKICRKKIEQGGKIYSGRANNGLIVDVEEADEHGDEGVSVLESMSFSSPPRSSCSSSSSISSSAPRCEFRGIGGSSGNLASLDFWKERWRSLISSGSLAQKWVDSGGLSHWLCRGGGG